MSIRGHAEPALNSSPYRWIDSQECTCAALDPIALLNLETLVNHVWYVEKSVQL
jgi:hypothetical protein